MDPSPNRRAGPDLLGNGKPQGISSTIQVHAAIHERDRHPLHVWRQAAQVDRPLGGVPLDLATEAALHLGEVQETYSSTQGRRATRHRLGQQRPSRQCDDPLRTGGVLAYRLRGESRASLGDIEKVDKLKIEIEEIEIGTRVSFGRPESMVEPAVGVVEKVNRMTYQIRLSQQWVQVRRTYPKGGRFRVSKGMVVRYLVEE